MANIKKKTIMSSKVQRGKIGTLKITFITDYLKKKIIIIIPGEKLYLSEGKSISGQISQNKKKNIVHSTLKIFFQYKKKIIIIKCLSQMKICIFIADSGKYCDDKLY